MHGNSFKLVAESLKLYCADMPKPRRVLDVGSYDVNGTYARLFDGDYYTGADLHEGPNVHVVLPEPYVLPFEPDTFDIVVCGQTLEHSPQPWRLVSAMGWVLKESGVLIIVAPGDGPWHMEPDTFRFRPGGMWGLAQWAGMRLVECRQESAPPWNDVLAIMRKGTLDE